MRHLNLFGIFCALGPVGCVIYPAPETNVAPVVLEADVLCTVGEFTEGDVWEFAALVDDERGPLEVVAVDAWTWDVTTGEDLLYFPLFPTNDAFVWASAWIVEDEPLDCADPNVAVDLVAWDSWGAWSVLTLTLETL